ncbi:hypothetical protein JCGZ_15277 [Jatropha curcas]|uniref:Uncharacterized protein n=1 Tax=Jatropha curcas TaxID=180498 RepID=A0A067KIM8_JATCU|nr:hypothetical protein JCGZ_15277 [Jatropha curcas]
MPFKQKARKKNDGSSSSVPTKKDLASRFQAEEEAEEIAGWKQVLVRVDALQQSQEKLQVTVCEMGQKLHIIQKENIEFTPSPPDSPEA